MRVGRVPLNLIDLGERDLVWFILNEVSTLYEYFNFVVQPAIGPAPRKGWDYVFLAEVDRQLLGLRADGLPGDIDVLIVPTLNGQLRPDLCCAIEVKRLALRGPNWSKNVDRYGISQAEGLLSDGFPFVGILHIVVANPGPEENKRLLEVWRVVDEYGRAERVGSEMRDMTGYDAAERQLFRLTSRSCAEVIGINSIAIARDASDNDRLWQSTRGSGSRQASRNLTQNPNLLRSIRELIIENRHRTPLRPADARKRGFDYEHHG